MILTNLPPRGSQAYKNLLALAGKEAWGQIQPYTQSEVWSMPRSRIENVLRQAERLGVKTTILGADWNHILKIPTAPVAVSRTQESIVKSMQGRKETTGVNVMTSPIVPMVDYALHKNEGKRVNAVRPGAAPSRIVIPLNENESIKVRRTAVEKKKDGCTWRGEIEDTGEPVILMWWKTGRFSGMFTYRGRTYLLKNIGGEVHAIVKTDPGKMPPDHAARKVTQGADVKDDPLVARGEGVTMRARDGAKSRTSRI